MRREPEHVEQSALFYWARIHEAQVPELGWLYAIPNGRYRPIAEARKLKKEGVKRGVPDLALDVPRGPFHGWRAEMKGPDGRESAEQKAWGQFLRAQGYRVGVFDDWKLAWNDLCSYLGCDHLAQKIWPHNGKATT